MRISTVIIIGLKVKNMDEKEQLIENWQAEFPVTFKVLMNFPPDKTDLKPHERSRSAKDLGRTFVFDMHLMRQAIAGKIDFGQLKFMPMPESWQEILASLEMAYKGFMEELEQSPESELNKPVTFGNGSVRRMDVVWEILKDMIHHRGQFSVYLRMAGGKVPSIYGPSADEP